MGAEELFLGYASTAAQAANTSTGITIGSGKGDYAAQRIADVKASEPKISNDKQPPAKSAEHGFERRS